MSHPDEPPSLLSLPAEVQLTVLSFCGLHTRWRVTRACKALRLVIMHSSLWLGEMVIREDGACPQPVVDALLVMTSSVRAVYLLSIERGETAAG